MEILESSKNTLEMEVTAVNGLKDEVSDMESLVFINIIDFSSLLLALGKTRYVAVFLGNPLEISATVKPV